MHQVINQYPKVVSYLLAVLYRHLQSDLLNHHLLYAQLAGFSKTFHIVDQRATLRK